MIKITIFVFLFIFFPGRICLEAIVFVEEIDFYKTSGYNPIGQLETSSPTRGTTPFPLFFQGWKSYPYDEIIRYDWDFGVGTENDPRGRYSTGFNGAHVFETPGMYVVTLTVWDINDNEASTTLEVEILAGDAGATYFIDSEIGDDLIHDGKCQTVSGTCGPWKTATKAFTTMLRENAHDPIEKWTYQPGDRILFKRGQTFDISHGVHPGHGSGTQGYYFADYGDTSQPKPIIQWSGTTEEHVLGGGYGALGYVGFVDLEFNFLGDANQNQTQAGGLIFQVDGCKNILLLRCDFKEPQNGAFSLGHVDNEINNVFVVDSTITQKETHATAVTQSFIAKCGNFAMMGNKFDISGNHIAYFCALNKSVITDNVFARPAFGRTAIRITGSGGSDDEPSDFVYIADNLFLGWIDPVSDSRVHNGQGTRYNYMLVNLGPNTPDAKFLPQNFIFERNVITNCEGCMNACNLFNSSIRNNLIVSPSDSSSTIFQIGSSTHWEYRPQRDLYIVNNLFLSVGNRFEDIIEYIPYSHQPPKTETFGNIDKNIQFKNNIVGQLNKESEREIFKFSFIPETEFSEMRMDNNIYYNYARSPSDTWFGIDDPVDSFNLEDWKELTNYEQDSVFVKSSAPNPWGGTYEDIELFSHVPGEPKSLEDAVVEAERYIEMFSIPSIGIGMGDPSVGVYFDFNGCKRGKLPDIGPFESGNCENGGTSGTNTAGIIVGIVFGIIGAIVFVCVVVALVAIVAVVVIRNRKFKN